MQITEKSIFLFGLVALLGTSVSYSQKKSAGNSAENLPLNETYTNPILDYGPDPWALYHDGRYYYMHTTPNNLVLWETDDITNLRNAKKKTI